jgi:hypothetical protein
MKDCCRIIVIMLPLKACINAINTALTAPHRSGRM